MNIKYILLILSVLLIGFSIILLTTDNKEFELYSISQIHSYKKTSDTEYFHIQLKTNDKDNYFFIKEEIQNASLTDGTEIVPLQVKDILIKESYEGYYIVDVSFKIDFDSDDYIIQFNQTKLILTYDKDELTIPIGEFNYLFKEENTNDLSLINLEATYDTFHNVETVSGVMITLNNKTNNNIVIKDISILSNTVDVMNDHVFILHEELDPFTKVEDILDSSFSHYDYESKDISIPISPDSNITLFGPLVFHSDIDYIHRFTLMITYTINDQEKVFYIDDFPFMRTSYFETDYIEYIKKYDPNR